MAKAVVTAAHDWRKIAELAGGDPLLIMFDPSSSELEVADVTQSTLDTALADYITNQSTYDAATVVVKETAVKESEKDRADVEKILKAILAGIRSEVNLLRAQHGFAARTDAQIRTFIRNHIDNS